MRIQIIGAACSGKSTLCEYISKKTGSYWIDTDKYIWKDEDYTENYSLEERMEMYNKDISLHSDYIVSGSVYFWNPNGFPNKELLVLLLLDEEVRIKRLYDREYKRFGERMLEGGDHFEISKEFLDWCKTYYTADENEISSFASHKLRLKQANCKTLVLDSNQPLESLYSCVIHEFLK